MNSSQDNVSEENDVVSGTLANGYFRYLALLFGLMGLVENLGIMVLVWAKRKLRRRPHMFFVLCLSFSDTLFLCNICMISLISFWSRTIPRLACSLQITTLHISFSASLIQTFVICLERYKAIQETPTAFAFYTRRKNLIVFVIWVFSALYMTTLFFVMPWSEDVSIKNCRVTVLYKEGYEQRIYAFLSMLYIPVLISTAMVYGLTAIRIKRKINRTFAIYNVSQTPGCHAPKTEFLPDAPRALNQSNTFENDENLGEISPGCEPVSIKAKQKLGNHLTYQKEQPSVSNAENAPSSFTSNIRGTAVTTALNTQRTDVINAQDIQGKYVPTAPLNIPEAEVSTAPNIQGAEVQTPRNTQEKDVSTAQNTQGKDVSVAPYIQGMDEQTALNIHTTDVTRAHEGRDYNDSSTIGGRGNDRIKTHSTNDVPSGSDNPSKELKVQRHGDGFVNERGMQLMKRAVTTVSLVVVTYLICLAPVMIECCVKVFTSTSPETSVFTIALSFLNSLMNPYLYVWRFTDLRKELTPKCW